MVAPKLDRGGRAIALRQDSETETRRREPLLLTVAYYAAHPDRIDARLEQLDQEWDIDRLLKVNGAGISLAGILFGLLGRKRWYVITLVVQSLLLQHAVQGNSAASALLERLGFRTSQDIEQERYALKALRGDFAVDVRNAGDPDALALKVLRATGGSKSERASRKSESKDEK
jgi:hypothetical protein